MEDSRQPIDAVELYRPLAPKPAATFGRNARAAANAGQSRNAGPPRPAPDPVESVIEADSLLGMHLTGFRIDRLICDGGFGAVYEGTQEWPPRSVCIKVWRLSCAPDVPRRHEQRQQAARALNHPRIATIYSSGVVSWAGRNLPFTVMESVADGRPIREFVLSRGLSLRKRLLLFRDVCAAVEHAHRHGVAHGHLTPRKILIDAVGQPKLVDFCNGWRAGLDGKSVTMGTIATRMRAELCYLSPEQYQAPPSQVDPRADVYSLGAVLYELVTGNPPYDLRNRSVSEALEILRRSRPVSPRTCNREVSPDVVELIGRCLKKNPGERFANAAETLEAFDGILGAPHRAPSFRWHDLVEVLGLRPDGALTTFTTTASWTRRFVAQPAAQRAGSLGTLLAWASLLCVGWAFLWIAAEIAHELLQHHCNWPVFAGNSHRLDEVVRDVGPLSDGSQAMRPPQDSHTADVEVAQRAKRPLRQFGEQVDRLRSLDAVAPPASPHDGAVPAAREELSRGNLIKLDAPERWLVRSGSWVTPTNGPIRGAGNARLRLRESVVRPAALTFSMRILRGSSPGVSLGDGDVFVGGDGVNQTFGIRGRIRDVQGEPFVYALGNVYDVTILLAESRLTLVIDGEEVATAIVPQHKPDLGLELQAGDDSSPGTVEFWNISLE